ncbi:MAG: extradiol ring-cleavage dioxygenase [Proteobacteria bacterium]|nr:extradiol ring-cleavage dioxygenase [Pseudomonadota bacterium]
MSVNVLERVLWEISVNGSSRKRFREDPDRFLASWTLTERERAMVRAFDVRSLAAEGVSPLLTMGFWMEAQGSRDLQAYLGQMKGAARG